MILPLRISEGRRRANSCTTPLQIHMVIYIRSPLGLPCSYRGSCARTNLHPEHTETLAVSIPCRTRVTRRTPSTAFPRSQCERETERVPRIRRLDDAVVPEACRCVQRSRLLLNFILERTVLRRIPTNYVSTINFRCLRTFLLRYSCHDL